MELKVTEKLFSKFLENLKGYLKEFQIEFQTSNPNSDFRATAYLLCQLKNFINLTTSIKKLKSDDLTTNNLDGIVRNLVTLMSEIESKNSLHLVSNNQKHDSLGVPDMELLKFNDIVSIIDSEKYLIKVDESIFKNMFRIILDSNLLLVYNCIRNDCCQSIENSSNEELLVEIDEKNNKVFKLESTPVDFALDRINLATYNESEIDKISDSEYFVKNETNENVSSSIEDTNNQNLKANLQRIIHFRPNKIFKTCKISTGSITKKLFPIFKKRLFKRRKMKKHRKNQVRRTNISFKRLDIDITDGAIKSNTDISAKNDVVDYLKERDNSSSDSRIESINKISLVKNKIKTINSCFVNQFCEKLDSESKSSLKKCHQIVNANWHKSSTKTITEDISEIPLDNMKQASNLNDAERYEKSSLILDMPPGNPGRASFTESTSISDNIFGLMVSQTQPIDKTGQNLKQINTVVKPHVVKDIPEIIIERTKNNSPDQILLKESRSKKIDLLDIEKRNSNPTKSSDLKSTESDCFIENLNHGFIELKSTGRDESLIRQNVLFVHRSSQQSLSLRRNESQIYEIKNDRSDYKKWYTVIGEIYGPVIKSSNARKQFFNRTSKYPELEKNAFQSIIDNFPIHSNNLEKNITTKSIIIMVKYFLIFLEELWRFIEKCPNHYFILDIKKIYQCMYSLFGKLSRNIGNTILQMHEYICLILKLQNILETKWLTEDNIRTLHRYQIKCQQYYMDETERVMIQYMYIPNNDEDKLRMFKRSLKDRRLWRLENLCHCRVILLQPDSSRNKLAPKGFRTIEIYYDLGRGHPKAAINLLNRLFDPQINTVREGPCVVKFLTGIFAECNRHKWLKVGSPRVSLKDYFDQKDVSYFCEKFKERKSLFGCKIVDNNILFECLKKQDVDYKTIFEHRTWDDY